MTALALIPLAIIVLAALYRPARPARIGFVERTARGVAPMEPPKDWQRKHLWAAKYGRTTIEQQLAPGAWPFAPSEVHRLPKSALVDVRELVR